MKKIVMGAIVLVSLLASCDKGTDCTRNVQQSILDGIDAAQLKIDQAIIDDYIAANQLGPVKEANGIKYILTKEGSGVIPCLENNVTVKYSGKLLSNGSVFDKNPNGATFPLNKLVLGWQLSFTTFTKGTVATIFIPSGYAYGPTGIPGRIPANANLIFDITLDEVR